MVPCQTEQPPTEGVRMSTWIRPMAVVLALVVLAACGSEPADDALTVENMATTVYRCLGINADKRLMAPGSRPIDIVRGGTVVQDLLA